MLCTHGRQGTILIKRKTTYFARETQNVFVGKNEMEKHMLSAVDTEGIIGVLAWRACDREGRRRFVAVKRERTMLAAMFQFSFML